jgi:hypothetical protein
MHPHPGVIMKTVIHIFLFPPAGNYSPARDFSAARDHQKQSAAFFSIILQREPQGSKPHL